MDGTLTMEAIPLPIQDDESLSINVNDNNSLLINNNNSFNDVHTRVHEKYNKITHNNSVQKATFLEQNIKISIAEVSSKSERGFNTT